MTVPPIDDIIVGVTHLSLGGQLVPLLKCPFCSFKNIHEEEITHHIKYKEDIEHNVDIDKIDKKRYIVTKKENRYHYTRKEDLPLPWIECLWCDYRDKVKRDLSWHFYEEHKYQLYNLDPFCFLYDIEHNIDKALELAKTAVATGPEENEKEEEEGKELE